MHLDTSLLAQIGFKPQDFLLVSLSPLCAALGSIVHGMLLEMNPSRLPTKGGVREWIHAAVIVKWFFYRIFIGGVLGLVIALYFVGSLTESPTSLARVLALAVLVGYSAPRLWLFQEQHLLQEFDKRIRVALGTRQSTTTSPNTEVERDASPQSGLRPLP